MTDEYLTIEELSAKIKYSKQSIYNMVHKKKLILGIHYFKPTPKKLLFRWMAMKEWVGDTSCSGHMSSEVTSERPLPKSSINI